MRDTGPVFGRPIPAPPEPKHANVAEEINKYHASVSINRDDVFPTIHKGDQNKIRKHSHYFKDVSKLESIDVYRVLELFGVTDQAIGHAVKKLLCAGLRGVKNTEKDIQEAIDTLNRKLQMMEEDKKE